MWSLQYHIFYIPEHNGIIDWVTEQIRARLNQQYPPSLPPPFSATISWLTDRCPFLLLCCAIVTSQISMAIVVCQQFFIGGYRSMARMIQLAMSFSLKQNFLCLCLSINSWILIVFHRIIIINVKHIWGSKTSSALGFVLIEWKPWYHIQPKVWATGMGIFQSTMCNVSIMWSGSEIQVRN